ncbi:MAG TPA: hypothetical protein VF613_01435 [Longimicrobium sp.]|jgi:hypothetical protein
MARHNREGEGEDQHGHRYRIGYQPDWFRQIKVTRDLENGRQSTKTLLRNPQPPLGEPGPRVLTEVEAPELGLSFSLTLQDERRVVRRIIVETVIPEGEERGQTISFVLSPVPDEE